MDPAKRPRSAFLTLLYFLLGAFAVVALVGGVGLYLFLRTGEGKRLLAIAKEGSALISEAALAPGADELRGIGCETALALPAGRILDLLRQIGPESRTDAIEESFVSAGGLAPETPVVFCAQRRGHAGTPDCASAAKVYASAVTPPPSRFVVLMAPRPGDLAGCSGIYAPDGSRLADLPKPGELSPRPQPASPSPPAAPAAKTTAGMRRMAYVAACARHCRDAAAACQEHTPHHEPCKDCTGAWERCAKACDAVAA